MPTNKLIKTDSSIGYGPSWVGIRGDNSDNTLVYNTDGTERVVVTTALTQTLTNKTFTAPAMTSAVLTSPTITTGITPTTTDGAALGSGSLMFSDLFLATGGVINFNNGNVTLTHAAGKITAAFPAPTSSIDCLTSSVTSGSATPGTVRALVGAATTFGTAQTSGNVVGARGQVTLGANLSGGFVYGAQGKLICGANTIAIGSGMAYGVMGQIDLSGTTITNGYVAGVGADIFGVSSGTVAADLFYGQHADGGTINSYFRAYGKSTYAFEFDINSGTAVTTEAAGAAANKWIRVRVDGTAYKVALLADS